LEVIVLEWGSVELLVTTADPNGFLSVVTDNNIAVADVKPLNELSFMLRVRDKDLKNLKRIGVQRSCEMKEVTRNGIVFFLKGMLYRPVLLAGVLLWLFLILYLPSKVLFVCVEGNDKIPEQLIMEHAERCGIVFGASRRNIRSEKIKNALLSAIPELQWVGVNTHGCLTIISVRERSVPDQKTDVLSVGHIVAAQDGVISDLTVTKGTALCATGQAVTKGQILVSGYTDCGFVLRAESASAEVMAITERELTAIVPQTCKIREKIIEKQVDYSIQIGKNIVELSCEGGMFDSSCAKICESMILTLPGGFQLPLALIRKTQIRYVETEENLIYEQNALFTLADAYLSEQMLMGQVLSSYFQQIEETDLCGVKGVYICEEMIGMLRKEEIGKENGK